MQVKKKAIRLLGEKREIRKGADSEIRPLGKGWGTGSRLSLP